MASALSPEFMERVQETAVAQIMAIAPEAVSQVMGDEGETYGDVKLTGADYVAWYVDLRQRGVLGMARVLKPKLVESWDRQFEREFAKMSGAA